MKLTASAERTAETDTFSYVEVSVNGKLTILRGAQISDLKVNWYFLQNLF